MLLPHTWPSWWTCWCTWSWCTPLITLQVFSASQEACVTTWPALFMPVLPSVPTWASELKVSAPPFTLHSPSLETSSYCCGAPPPLPRPSPTPSKNLRWLSVASTTYLFFGVCTGGKRSACIRALANFSSQWFKNVLRQFCNAPGMVQGICTDPRAPLDCTHG